MSVAINSKTTPTRAALRKFPYPYRAALTICNDADSMTAESLRFIHRYLNTDKETPLGRGLSLPVGDSFFLFSSPASPNKLTLFEGISSKLSPHADFLSECARSEMLDTLHTYGCFTSPDDFSRSIAERGIEELDRRGIQLRVWVNHGTSANVQCFGLPEIEHYRGDIPGTKFYHTDITLAYGIRFCWLGEELSDCIGQDSSSSLQSLIDRSKTMLKHLSKRQLSRARQQNKRLMRSATLRDGNQVLSFKRYAGTLGLTPVIDDLPNQLSQSNLEKLKASQGYSIIYQHFAVRRKGNGFGVSNYKPNSEPFFLPAEKAALERLAREFHNGNIFVTTTSRLLQYNLAQKGLKWNQQTSGGRVRIILDGIDEPGGLFRGVSQRDVESLTFYTPRPRETELFIKNGRGEELVTGLIYNPPDDTGRESVTVPPSTRAYPDL